MMKRLLIIDGHNLLFQMFFGFPVKLYNSKGKMYQGVLGFVGALLKIIKMTNPTHVVVLFDSEKRTVRSDIYEEYKSNRIDYNLVEEQDNPFSQLEDIFKSLDCLSIKYKEIETYETDDVIASYVYKYKDDCEIFISSFDSDFFQLIDENVKVLRYRGDNSVICDEEYLKKKYLIEPNTYSLFKSLVGDSADNIKGVKGIGPKTASEIVNICHTFDELKEKYKEVCKKRVIGMLENNFELIKRNLDLIDLTGDAPIPYTIDQIEYTDKKKTTNTVLSEIGIK